MVRDLDHRRQKTDLAPEPTDFSWTKWSGFHTLGGPTRRIHSRRTSPTPSSVIPSPRWGSDIYVRNGTLFQDRFATKHKSLRWPNGIVFYTLDEIYSESEKTIIRSAMDEFEKQTCIKWVERTEEDNYVEIYSEMGCWSELGRVGGVQSLALESPACMKKGLIMHELMHALGFLHEQSRFDRDEYVKVVWSNIIEDVETNEQHLCNSIFKALTNLGEFQLTLNNSETSFSEGENVVSKTTFQKRITLDRNFLSEGTDQHSPFQHPVSNAPLPSVHVYSFMPAHQNVSSLCTQNTFPPYSNDASLTEMNTQFWTLLRDISVTSRKFTSEDFYSVNSFVRDIEENFDLFRAINSQKLIFAKRLVC
ncbi:zinc metalloproteinase nas-15 [Trichonephila clavipes]|nr:zinc metalloproteinase nas-15 [Trichonephila clavipes]